MLPGGIEQPKVTMSDEIEITSQAARITVFRFGVCEGDLLKLCFNKAPTPN